MRSSTWIAEELEDEAVETVWMSFGYIIVRVRNDEELRVGCNAVDDSFLHGNASGTTGLTKRR